MADAALTTAVIPLIQGPQSVCTLEKRPGFRFIGLIRDLDHAGNPFWEAVELLQWMQDGRLFNLNSGNITHLEKHLTHWMPEPPP